MTPGETEEQKLNDQETEEEEEYHHDEIMKMKATMTMLSRFQWYNLLSFLPLGARKQSDILTIHSLYTST